MLLERIGIIRTKGYETMRARTHSDRLEVNISSGYLEKR